MPPTRFILILLAVLVMGAVTVLLMIALPPDVHISLIPILMIAAIALRVALGRR